jgi:tRNA(Ile)-lysidine synthase
LLIALSGGPDSTALTLAMHKLASTLEIAIEAGHFNHHARGAESDEDERFCRDLCAGLSIPVHFGSIAVQSSPADHSEASLREARYEFLLKTVISTGAYGLVTAHTMDDQAETVLLAITRGAGLRGAAGMSPVTTRPDLDSGAAAKIIRPMLGIRKSEAAAYCAEQGVAPREDSSNRDLRYARNRMRHAVLPELAKLNPNVIESLSRLSNNLARDLELLDDTVARYHAQAAVSTLSELSRPALAAIPGAALPHVLAAAFAAAAGTSDGLEQVHIEAMSEMALGAAGRSLDLPYGVRMTVDTETVRFMAPGAADSNGPYPPQVKAVVFSVPGEADLSNGARIVASIIDCPVSLDPLTPWSAFLDPALATGEVTVRSRREGDRFQPLGMAEQVKLQDFMVNAHVPERWRDRVPLVLTGQGIAWVAGQRIAEWAKVPPGASKALLLEYRSPAATGSGPASG